jgi:hypothetical protein
MLVYKLQKLGKIPKNWTWKLLQKFDTQIDLNKIEHLQHKNLTSLLAKDKEVKS